MQSFLSFCWIHRSRGDLSRLFKCFSSLTKPVHTFWQPAAGPRDGEMEGWRDEAAVCGLQTAEVKKSKSDVRGTSQLNSPIMPWCSPLKQGIMLQNNPIGGWNDLVWSPHRVIIIIIIIIIICLYIYYLQTQKTPCCSFFLKLWKNLQQCIKINVEFKIALVIYP